MWLTSPRLGGPSLLDSYNATISFRYSAEIASTVRPATTRPWLDHLPPATEPVLVRRLPLGGETPRAALERVRRLAALRHPNLLPILGAEIAEAQPRAHYEDDDGR